MERQENQFKRIYLEKITERNEIISGIGGR